MVNIQKITLHAILVILQNRWLEIFFLSNRLTDAELEPNGKTSDFINWEHILDNIYLIANKKTICLEVM